MKLKRIDTDTLLESIGNGSCLHGRGHLHIGSFIGAVETVIGVDGEGCYDTDLALAVQLPHGPIVAVDDKNNITALNKNMLYTIHWGLYPIDFPDNMKTRRPCPKGLQPPYSNRVETAPAAAVTADELPF